ncbi:MAG: hypothetical protein OXM57_08355 [bacterium]|nr:hypothetical protein [bacterium]MDE0352690.1 hypothetical protein [bacterium]
MNPQSMIIAIGLVALLIAYAAVRDSRDGWSGTVGPLKWSFSGSWSSSIAVVLALVLVLFGLGAQANTLAGFGILSVLAPLIYKGIGGSEGASKPVFFIVSAIMTWSTLVILYTAATVVPNLTSTLPILPVLVINAALVLALLGAVINSVRNLAAAASGDGSEAWILP